MQPKIKFQFDDHVTELLRIACLTQANACGDMLQSRMYLNLADQFKTSKDQFQRQWERHLNKTYKPAPKRS